MVVVPGAKDFDSEYEEIVHSIMLASSYDRPAVRTASTTPAVDLSPSLEGLENAIPPISPLSLAGRPYYLQLDKPLPEKPLPETPPPMGYSTAWSHDTSSVGSSSRCSSREWSRYSRDSCPVIVNSGSDDGDLDGSMCDRPMSHPESVGKDHGFGSSVLAPGASPDLLESFLADGDDADDESDNNNDQYEYENYNESDSNSKNDSNDDEKDQYGLKVQHTILDWTQNQYGPNHYFREKKWDFFPELATPNALPNGTWPPGRPASALQSRPSKKRHLSAFDFGKLNLTRGNTTGTTASLSERPGLALASNVRNSIRSVVQRTLSKPTALEKEKEKRRRQPRPSTAQRSETTATTASNRSGNSCDDNSRPPQQNHEDVVSASNRMRSLSVSPCSSTTGTTRPRPLAIPLSPYQKYGAAIWDKHRGSRRSRIGSYHVRFPRYYQNQRRWSSSLLSSSSTNTSNQSNRLTQTQSDPVLPVSVSPPPPIRSLLQCNTREYVRALQNGTSHMLGVLNGAKRKVIGARMDRRRAQLKAQIRLVGPVDPYSTHQGVDPWV